MSQIFSKNLIDKITYLEKKLGHGVHYNILDPFPVHTKDIIGIQNVGKIIANFIGLSDIVFIITIDNLKENQGGNIELNRWEKDVFVSISKNVIQYDDAILSTIGHELTHKYLHMNSISLPNSYENEILTDIAAVYLGLGKIMLNGCKCEKSETKCDFSGTSTHTQTFTTGYLSHIQLAFVYRIISEMRKIPQEEQIKLLNSKSRELFYELDNRAIRSCYDSALHEDSFKQIIADNDMNIIKKCQIALSETDRTLIFIKKCYIDKVEKYLNRVHKDLNNIILKAHYALSKKWDNPCLRFLDNAALDINRDSLQSYLNKYDIETAQYKKKNISLVKRICCFGKFFKKPSIDMFNIVKCWNCNTKLKLPQNKPRGRVICPKCSYEFSVDTTLLRAKKPFILKRIFNFNRF
jgi:hypothetical protein